LFPPAQMVYDLNNSGLTHGLSARATANTNNSRDLRATKDNVDADEDLRHSRAEDKPLNGRIDHLTELHAAKTSFVV